MMSFRLTLHILNTWTKPKEVFIRYNVTISTLLNIQAPSEYNALVTNFIAILFISCMFSLELSDEFIAHVLKVYCL